MGNQLFSWINPKLEIRPTEKYGKAKSARLADTTKVYRTISTRNKGVFAKEGVKKGEVLLVMGGYILTIEDENNLTGIIADKPIEVSEWFSIGPRKPSDLERMPQHFVNHSCNPNAGFKGNIFMVALRDIALREEITYDYAMVMHPNRSSTTYFKMKCLCGQENCRGYITEDDWTIPELQKRYNGYFQWYLQEKIDRKRRSGQNKEG